FAIGARLNIQLFSGDVLVAAIVISLLAIISKVIGCGLPVLNEGWPTVFRVGIGMMPRGEVALIVALVGLQSRIVTQSTYAIVVFMTGITTLLAPPLLRYLFRDEIPQDEEIAEFGKIDILVNNAGITRDQLVMRMKRADWDAVINTNLTSAYLCTQQVISAMLRQRWGRIINITSIFGQIGQTGQANYASSKA